jgi:hypothetical protein
MAPAPGGSGQLIRRGVAAALAITSPQAQSECTPAQWAPDWSGQTWESDEEHLRVYNPRIRGMQM